jgi:hypothetical protein
MRSLFSSLAVTFVALSAHALATVDVTAVGTPLPGATITLQVHVSVTPADGNDSAIFGSLVYPTSGIAAPTPGTQTPLGETWGGAPLACNTSRCVMFSQVNPLGPNPADLTNFLIAQQDYSILPGTLPGTVLTWTWQTTPTATQLDFYNAVAPVPAVEITVVPEPTTAALLCIGLLVLAKHRHNQE